MGNRISDEELLAEIHRLKDEYGKATTTLLRKHGNYSSRTYSLRFGSWSNALELAGLEQNVIRGLTEEELLNELHRIAEIVGRTPKESDVKEQGICSRGPFLDQFGSWNEAVRAFVETHGIGRRASWGQRRMARSGKRDEKKRFSEMTKSALSVVFLATFTWRSSTGI